MKTLAELQAACARLGLTVAPEQASRKEAWVEALRKHLWEKEHADAPLPPQVQPMLISDWADLGPEEAAAIEDDHHAWLVQPKLDGCRALLHVEPGGVRVTGRSVSEVTFRLSEFQANLPHLGQGWDGFVGTVLDGELVCPEARINTGGCETTTALQAATAVLATSSDNAAAVQQQHRAWLRFHAFDLLRLDGRDATGLPLAERQSLLAEALTRSGNPHVELVPSYAVNKRAVHESIVNGGGEGTVWKRCDQPYQPGNRVRHWIKRKRVAVVEAFVTGFKPGSAGRGNRHLVGAVEFSARGDGGAARPVAWVSNWTDAERRAMTASGGEGVGLNPAYLGRRAVVAGQNHSARSGRVRHARLVRWLDGPQTAASENNGLPPGDQV